MSAFGRTFVDDVVIPWKEACEQAPKPWEATPGLRKEWLEGIGSASSTRATACAIGLARCANLEMAEFQAVNGYFDQLPEGVLPDKTALDLVLTGASPPVTIGEGAIRPMLESDELPPAEWWPILATFLRHPAHLAVAQGMLEAQEGAFIGYYNALANPTLYFPAEFPPGMGGRSMAWLRALKYFHPRAPKPDWRDLYTYFDRFAFFMRCDFEKEEFAQLCRDVLLEQPFVFAQAEHPCAEKGRCPEHDPRNPSLEAIEFFSGEGKVSALYRFYNPLLNYPWFCEQIAGEEEVGTLMGLLLMGHIPVNLSRGQVSRYPKILSLLYNHPAWEVNLFQRAVVVSEMNKDSETEVSGG